MHINRHINNDISTCTSPFLRRLRCAHDTVVHVGGGPGSMPTKHTLSSHIRIMYKWYLVLVHSVEKTLCFSFQYMLNYL